MNETKQLCAVCNYPIDINQGWFQSAWDNQPLHSDAKYCSESSEKYHSFMEQHPSQSHLDMCIRCGKGRAEHEQL